MVWLKKLIGILIALAILGLIVGLIMVFMVDPNDFRVRINNDLKSYTGLPLEVKGPIQWNLRPKAKLRLQDVVLNKSPANPQPVLTIKEVVVDFDGFSFFTDNLQITNLDLNDVAIDLDLLQTINKKDKPAKNSTIEALNIKNLSFLNASQVSNLSWQFKNSVLSASNLKANSTELTPFKVSGDLSSVNNEATFNIDAVLKIDASKHTLILNPLKIMWNDTTISGDSNIVQYEDDMSISGTLGLENAKMDAILTKLDPNYTPSQESKVINGKLDYKYQVNAQMLELTNIQLQANNGMITGNLKTSLAAQSHIEFDITADTIDFKPLLLMAKALMPKLPDDNLMSVDFVKNLTINGKFNGTNLHFNNDVQFDQVGFNVVGQNGVLQFNPVAIQAYGALHNITLSLDVVTKSQPYFQITEQAKNVDLEPWMNLIHQKKIIDGNASIKASLEAVGNTLAMLKQTITGSINMYVSDGVLYNIDTTALMNFTAKAIADIFTEMSKSPKTDLAAIATSKSNEWVNSQEDNPSTKFDEFELKTDIDQGISKKASISMNNTQVDLKATGGFNLRDDTLDFTGTLISKTSSTNTSDTGFLTAYMTKIPLPIIITGTIQKPIFGPNIQEYATNILALAKNDLLNQAITKMVAVTPPNIKTSKTGSELFLDSLQSLTTQ